MPPFVQFTHVCKPLFRLQNRTYSLSSRTQMRGQYLIAGFRSSLCRSLAAEFERASDRGPDDATDHFGEALVGKDRQTGGGRATG